MQFQFENQKNHLAGLNEQQREAVLCKANIVYVNAGPGTGKTHMLTSKLVDIIQSSTAPEKIVALSYTNTAARQIGDRFDRKMADLGITKEYSLFNGTIHSFCYRMMKRYSQEFSDIILDDEELIELGEDILEKFPEYKLADIQDCLRSDSKAIPALYWEVQKIKHSLHVISIQDILTEFIKRLDEEEPFRKWIAGEVTVMAVDEAQDLTELHYAILDRMLYANPDLRVFLVGDPRQNIFEFNGGSYKNLDGFLHRHEDHVTKSLTITYRCGQAIADYVNRFQFNDCDNLQLQSRCADAGHIVIKNAFNEEEEAREVLKAVLSTGNINQCAVLCNNLKYLEVLIKQLLEREIPYKVFGGRRILKKHIRFVNHIFRIIDSENAYSIRKIAQYAGIDISEEGKKKKSRFFASELGQIIQSIRDEVDHVPFQQTAERVISEIMLDPSDTPELVADYMNLLSLCSQYDSASAYLMAFATDKETFMPFYKADYIDCPVPTDKGFLTISTIHSAKGLEWDNVFIMGLCEGIFPNPFFCKSLPPDEQEEFYNAEWKKMYVASTRAKENLCLSYASSIKRKGYSFHKEPSRFINNCMS